MLFRSDLMPVLDSIPEDERTTDYFLSFLAGELSVEKGVGINNQVDLMPVLDSIPEDERTTDYFLSFQAGELSVYPCLWP